MESHFYQFSRLAITFLVGEVPSAASALPNQCGVPSLPVPRRYKNRTSLYVAWYAHGGGNGRCLDCNAAVMLSPQCRL